jgi:hypothetical protein
MQGGFELSVASTHSDHRRYRTSEVLVRDLVSDGVSSSGAYPAVSPLRTPLFALSIPVPLVEHSQQAARGSGIESHQGRLDHDSRPGAEEFRASSSWRLA